MRFFTDKSSLASLKIFITAAVVGVPLEPAFIDLAANENLTEEFLQMSPFGLVPVLEVDKDKGEYLWECTSICRYALSKQKKLSFMPKEGTKERTLAEQWIEFIDSADSIDAILHRAEKSLSDLGGSRAKFLFGDSLSLVDILLWCAIYPRSAELPARTKAWFDTLSQEKHFITGLERAGVKSPSDLNNAEQLMRKSYAAFGVRDAQSSDRLPSKLEELEIQAHHSEIVIERMQARIDEIDHRLDNIVKENSRKDAEISKLRYRVNHLIRMLEGEEKKNAAPASH